MNSRTNPALLAIWLAVGLLLTVSVLPSSSIAQESPAADGASTAEAGAPVSESPLVPANLGDMYGETYTVEELDALATALWAGNMTPADMHFEKDYAKGYLRYPVVERMMDDPLYIAQWMDLLAASAQRDGALDDDMYRLIVNAASLANNTHDSNYSEFAAPAALPALQGELTALVNAALPLFAEDPRIAVARREITAAMAWHDFEGLIGEASVEDSANKELYALLTELEPKDYYRYADFFRLILMLRELPWSTALFAKGDHIIIPGQHGRIGIGTYGDDYYEGDFAVLIDPGGNDHYKNCRIGAAYGMPTENLGDGRVGYFADLGGNDFYDCGDVDITLGAAVLGVAAFYDLGSGNDRYVAGNCSLGAAMAGLATFYDDGGQDTYESKVYSQGAAGFGLGIMVDDSTAPAPSFDTAEGNDKVIDAHERDSSAADPQSAMDNDTYTAWSESQGFARTRGVALCINARGNENYSAGGVYLHAPLFSDRYQSFSQGFAIGEREIDYSGGIAMLLDYAGNDRYLGDIYNQGVGYWYSAGLLWDNAGNDLYEMTQYGQGSGIHLAIGGLIDNAGNDGYIMHSGLGQGGSHDFAASVLHDRGGDDRYMGTTTCNGAAVTNSVGLHIDRSGNDTYGARREHGINAATAARGFGSIGVLIDVTGKDDYLGIMADGELWRHMDTGMGWDMPTPEEALAAGVGSVDKPGENVPIPAIVAYEGPLTQEVFDELWEVSIRWEVGDNRVIVPQARDRLAAFGTDVLPYINAEMDDNYSLAVLAYVYIFNKLLEVDRAAVVAVLDENARSADLQRRITALRVIGDMKLLDAEDAVVLLLDDTELERRAIATLGLIGSHAADTELVLRLKPETPEPVLIAAIIATTDLKIMSTELQMLLDHPSGAIRSTVIGQLIKHYLVYKQDVGSTMVNVLSSSQFPDSPDLQPSWIPGLHAQRALLEILTRLDSTAEDTASSDDGDIIYGFWKAMITAPDWGVRADAYRLLHSLESKYGDAETEAYRTLANELMTNNETNPYVLSVARGETP